MKLSKKLSLKLKFIFILFFLFLFNTNAQEVNENKVLIFSAASLRDSLTEILNNLKNDFNISTIVSYGSSSSLAKQIENGAPASIYLSASRDWIGYLEKLNMLEKNTTINLLSNRLVVISSIDNYNLIKDNKNFNYKDLLINSEKRIALAFVRAVPAGIYAKEALVNLGIWEKVKYNLAQCDNVRSALHLVSRNESSYGLVYHSDSVAEKNVMTLSYIPRKYHRRIVYPIAITKGKKTDRVLEVVNYIKNNKSKEIFEKWGFIFFDEN